MSNCSGEGCAFLDLCQQQARDLAVPNYDEVVENVGNGNIVAKNGTRAESLMEEFISALESNPPTSEEEYNERVNEISSDPEVLRASADALEAMDGARELAADFISKEVTRDCPGPLRLAGGGVIVTVCGRIATALQNDESSIGPVAISTAPHHNDLVIPMNVSKDTR